MHVRPNFDGNGFGPRASRKTVWGDLIRTSAVALFNASSALNSWLLNKSPLSPYLYDARNAKDFGELLVHEIMLSDSERLETYRRAIQRLVRPSDVVVDLGTGTGVLAFFAAEQGATVHAIEHADIISTAESIASESDIRNVVFHRCNSRQFKLEKRADVLIHEQIGGGNPFSENMVQNICDLRRRVLKEAVRIIPNKFEIYLEPVELKERYRVPFLWELEVEGINLATQRRQEYVPGEGEPLIPYHMRTIAPEMVERLLCEPKPIMTFDLQSVEPGDLSSHVSYVNTATKAGRIDGLCIYFKAFFDENLILETSPIGHSTSWKMSLYRLEAREVQAGERLAYDLILESITKDRTWRLRWAS